MTAFFDYSRKLFTPAFNYAVDHVDRMLKHPLICERLLAESIEAFAMPGFQRIPFTPEELAIRIGRILGTHPAKITCSGVTAEGSILQVQWRAAPRGRAPTLAIDPKVLLCTDPINLPRCIALLITKLLYGICHILVPLFFELNGFPLEGDQEGIEAPLHFGTVWEGHKRMKGNAGYGFEDKLLGGRLACAADESGPYEHPLRLIQGPEAFELSDIAVDKLVQMYTSADPLFDLDLLADAKRLSTPPPRPRGRHPVPPGPGPVAMAVALVTPSPKLQQSPSIVGTKRKLFVESEQAQLKEVPTAATQKQLPQYEEPTALQQPAPVQPVAPNKDLPLLMAVPSLDSFSMDLEDSASSGSGSSKGTNTSSLSIHSDALTSSNDDMQATQPCKKRRNFSSDSTSTSSSGESSSSQQTDDEDSHTWQQAACKVLRALKHHAYINSNKDPIADFFHPVVELYPTIAEEYLAIIPKPMDLGTLAVLLDSSLLTDVQEFYSKLLSVFENALAHNSLTVSEYAQQLSRQCHILLKHTRWLCLETLPFVGGLLTMDQQRSARDERMALLRSMDMNKMKNKNQECLSLLLALEKCENEEQQDVLAFFEVLQLAAVPDYQQHVSCPMDLVTVKYKLCGRMPAGINSEPLDSIRYSNYAAFFDDLRRVFTNALTYNAIHKDEDDSGISRMLYEAAQDYLERLDGLVPMTTLRLADRIMRGDTVDSGKDKDSGALSSATAMGSAPALVPALSKHPKHHKDNSKADKENQHPNVKPAVRSQMKGINEQNEDVLAVWRRFTAEHPL